MITAGFAPAEARKVRAPKTNARAVRGRSKPISRATREREGRDARDRLSRSRMGELRPKNRGFDALQVLSRATEDRVPKLLGIKYKRMSASPFAFFRGAVSIMAADFAQQAQTGIAVQLCGDAHVQNLGAFEAPDGRIVFDINDFDETIAGPWEWDVKRMAASIVLAGREVEHDCASCTSAVETFAAHYLRTVEELADQPILTAARYQIHRLEKTPAVSAVLRVAERSEPSDLIKKYTKTDARGRVEFRKIESVLWRLQGDNRHAVLDSLAAYRKSLPPERLHLFDYFRPIDVAFKVVGTGSVGLRDYVVLMEGNGQMDPLFLQIKQESKSAYDPYLKHPKYEHEGYRVAEGQRKVQPISDLMLGWTTIGEHHYLVRQLSDHKGGIEISNLKGRGLGELAAIAGELLARGHARSGDALAIRGYAGSGDKVLNEIIRYANGYAAIAQADFDGFRRAIDQGRFKVAE